MYVSLRAHNPHAILILYTLTETRAPGNADGYIPKWDTTSHKNVAYILTATDDDLQSIEALRKAFPGLIKTYADLDQSNTAN